MRRGREAIHRARARVQRCCEHARDKRRRASSRGEGHRAWRRAAAVSNPNDGRVDDPARSRQVSRAAARIRPHGGNGVRPVRRAAVRHDRRHPRCRAVECARNAQHPRRALRHLPRRLRSASVRRPAAARRAGGMRDLPPPARCARAGGRTRREVRAQSGPREDADVRRRVLVQGSVRHEGHADDCRRRRALRHRFSRARSRARRPAAQERRDHLREGGLHRIQRPRRQPGRPPRAREGAALRARLPEEHMGRQSVQSLRHDARCLAGLELRLGRVGQRQPGDGEPG